MTCPQCGCWLSVDRELACPHPYRQQYLDHSYYEAVDRLIAGSPMPQRESSGYFPDSLEAEYHRWLAGYQP